jgi:hypothetical protein
LTNFLFPLLWRMNVSVWFHFIEQSHSKSIWKCIWISFLFDISFLLFCCEKKVLMGFESEKKIALNQIN